MVEGVVDGKCGWWEAVGCGLWMVGRVREKALEPSGCMSGIPRSQSPLCPREKKVRLSGCGLLNPILPGQWKECRERDATFYGVGIVWVGYII